MKTQQSPEVFEIIEIIDDDTDAFGDRQSRTTADTGGPRWVGPVAAAALAGLIGYGVVTSTSTNGPPKAAPITTTSISTVTTATAVTNSISPHLPDAYYAADPPPEFTVQDANAQALDHAPFQGYAYELWGTAGASATSGRWFSVSTYRSSSTVAPEAYRLQAGQLSIAISHIAGGETITQFTQLGRTGVTITSFGWSDDDLVRLASAIQADERSIGFTDASFKKEQPLISTVQPWLAVQSIPAEQITYTATDDPANNVVITVGHRLQPHEGGSAAQRQIALRFLLNPNTPFIVDGEQAVAGLIVGQGERALATWITGDHVITVSATMPISQLISIARTVHQVSAREWDGMRFRAENRQVSNSRYEKGPAHQLLSGSENGSDIWVATANSGGQEQLSWSWTSNGLATTPDGTAQIHTMVDNDRTYVLADLPRSVSPSGFLRIRRGGDESAVVVPFIDVDPAIDRTFAGHSFAEPGPYNVELVGSDGAVLATWPTQ